VTSVSVTYFNDPGCPWGYSETPALQVLRWRYRDQLDWRFVTIGLTESADQYEQRGYTPGRMAHAYTRFRRYGMPFATTPRPRVAATARACRAICAVRLHQPELELMALRALQFGWFTTTLVLDEDEAIASALGQIDGLEVERVIDAIDDPAVEAAYQSDWAEARTAAGGATQLQNKTANSDGAERYTAPSLIFETQGQRVEAGGFQPVEAYDVLLANLDTGLERRDPPEEPLPLLDHFRQGLTTAEVAALLAQGNDAPNLDSAEGQLIDLAAAGNITRTPLGDSAVWTIAGALPVGAKAEALATSGA
jgi:protein-disulfide isomerase-like protein with CxxC motif